MRQWLDRVTGAVTMYKLVILLLAAIGLIALLLSLFGQLRSIGPLHLLASAAVVVVATNATNFAIAKVLRVPQHLDSSMITALLLFFVMDPRLDLVGLASIALAGAIASVSKYLIAVRGRHVLNPAAVGAFVVTLLLFAGVSGFSYARWWVGTPYLLLPVAIGAFLVLYRTQKLTMGAVFLVVVLAAVAMRYSVAGTPVPQALTDTLLSGPAVFFVGFMLSEPLTLPPRRWQQLAEAVLVGLLFAVPFRVGIVGTSPQLALLVGNLGAFFAGQRRGIRMTYLGKQQLGDTTWELSFQPARPVRFSPGQYMELNLPHRAMDFRGSRRYFSVASAPSDDGPITFAITKPAKSSSFKQALLDLEPGSPVHGSLVGGDFVLPKDVSEPLLLVAGGIGITPFASQLAFARQRGEQRDVVVAYATSATGPLPYRALLEESGARVVLFAPEAPSPLPPGWQYGGTGRVTGERLAELVPDVARRRAYVSGPPALVTQLRRALRSQGARRVHADYFSGY